MPPARELREWRAESVTDRGPHTAVIALQRVLNSMEADGWTVEKVFQIDRDGFTVIASRPSCAAL